MRSDAYGIDWNIQKPVIEGEVGQILRQNDKVGAEALIIYYSPLISPLAKTSVLIPHTIPERLQRWKLKPNKPNQPNTL